MQKRKHVLIREIYVSSKVLSGREASAARHALQKRFNRRNTPQYLIEPGFKGTNSNLGQFITRGGNARIGLLQATLPRQRYKPAKIRADHFCVKLLTRTFYCAHSHILQCKSENSGIFTEKNDLKDLLRPNNSANISLSPQITDNSLTAAHIKSSLIDLKTAVNYIRPLQSSQMPSSAKKRRLQRETAVLQLCRRQSYCKSSHILTLKIKYVKTAASRTLGSLYRAFIKS